MVSLPFILLGFAVAGGGYLAYQGYSAAATAAGPIVAPKAPKPMDPPTPASIIRDARGLADDVGEVADNVVDMFKGKASGGKPSVLPKGHPNAGKTSTSGHRERNRTGPANYGPGKK